MTGPATQSELVPGWLQRSAAVGWRVLATVGVGVVLLLVASTIPISVTATLVSLVLAAALAPTAIRLRFRGLARPVAAAITFGGGALLIIAVAIVLVVVLVPDLRSIGAAAEQGLDAIRDRLAEAGAPEQVASLVDSLGAELRASIAADPAAVVGTIANVGTVLVLGTFLTFFLLADGDRGWDWAMRSLEPWHQEAVSSSARAGVERVAWYVRRTGLLAAVDGVVVFLVLAAFGVPYAGALGAVAFLAGFVPYLGAVVGGAVIVLSALALGGALPAVAVVVALVADWVVATRLLERTRMSRSVDVHPLVVLVALPAGIALFGILGLLALLPVTVFGLAVSRSVIAVLDLAPQGALGTRPDGPGPATAALPPGVPLWLDRLGQWSWRALVLAALAWITIAVVVRVPMVVVPAVIAMVAAAALLPLMDRLARRGWRRSVAAASATVGVVVFVAVTCLAAIALTLGPLTEVIQAAAAGATEAQHWLAGIVTEYGAGIQVELAALVADLVGLALAMVLALLMTFFFLRDGRAWWRVAIDRLAPRRRALVGEAGGRAVALLAGYMVGTAIISAFGGITTGLTLVVLGLPLALPITVIGFYAGFIPYVGSFVTTALALLVTVALGTTTDIVIMLVFTVVFNIAQGNFVTPIVYGRSLSLHPAIVLMAIPVGNEIAGMLGMFLIVPVAAMVAATWRLVIQAIDVSETPPAPAAGVGDPEPGTPADAAAPNLTRPDTIPPVPSGA